LHKLKGNLRTFWSIDGITKSEDNEVFDYPTGVVLPPVHPGRILARELEARELTANALALKLRVPAPCFG
jgi:hypothetical protein